MSTSHVQTPSAAGEQWMLDNQDRCFVVPDPASLVTESREDEYLFIDQRRGYWWRTNDVGRRIVELCCARTTVGQISTRLAEEYSMPADVVRQVIGTFLQKAIQRMYIVPADAPGDAQAENPPAQQIQMLWLEVTQACQLKCPYCYAYSRQEARTETARQAQPLTPQELAALLTEDEAGRNARRIVITGGEPTLRPDLLALIRAIRQATQSEVNLTTNGILEAPDLWREIAGLVDEVQVSIDGPTAQVHDRLRGAGSFDRSVATVQLLSATPLKHLHIGFTPTDLNLHALPAMVHFAYECGASLLHVNMFNAGEAARSNGVGLNVDAFVEALEQAQHAYMKLIAFISGSKEEQRARPFRYIPHVDQLPKLQRARRRTSCGMACGTVRINPFGDVYPCSDLRGPAWCFGNVRETPLAEIYRRMLEWQAPINVDHIPSCQQCHIRYICGGGCRASAVHATGDIHGKDPHCEYLRRQIEHRLWNFKC